MNEREQLESLKATYDRLFEDNNRVTDQLLKANARIARLEEIQAMYCARRHAAYLMRRKLQMSGVCLLENTFNVEYDEASQRYVCGIVNHL